METISIKTLACFFVSNVVTTSLECLIFVSLTTMIMIESYLLLCQSFFFRKSMTKFNLRSLYLSVEIDNYYKLWKNLCLYAFELIQISLHSIYFSILVFIFGHLYLRMRNLGVFFIPKSHNSLFQKNQFQEFSNIYDYPHNKLLPWLETKAVFRKNQFQEFLDIYDYLHNKLLLWLETKAHSID